MQKNKYDVTGKCLSRGLAAQQRFENIAKKRQNEIRASGRNEDMNKHIDYWIEETSYDVKAVKKLNSGDKDVDYDIVWIELHGVRKNDAGWLYNGCANFIAFESVKGFILFDRKELLTYIDKIQKKIRQKDGVHPSPRKKQLYRIYSRRDRNDEIICVKLSDLQENLTYREWHD